MELKLYKGNCKIWNCLRKSVLCGYCNRHFDLNQANDKYVEIYDLDDHDRCRHKWMVTGQIVKRKKGSTLLPIMSDVAAGVETCVKCKKQRVKKYDETGN